MRRIVWLAPLVISLSACSSAAQPAAVPETAAVPPNVVTWHDLAEWYPDYTTTEFQCVDGDPSSILADLCFDSAKSDLAAMQSDLTAMPPSEPRSYAMKYIQDFNTDYEEFQRYRCDAPDDNWNCFSAALGMDLAMAGIYGTIVRELRDAK